jgi:Secretion system C-terminal sorting domain
LKYGLFNLACVLIFTIIALVSRQTLASKHSINESLKLLLNFTNMKKRLLFFAAMLFALATIQAQSPTGVIRYTESSQFNKFFHKVIQASDGSIVTVGGLHLNGLACKFSSGFAPLWTLTMDSVSFRDVVETNDGNYVFLGNVMKVNMQNNPVCVVKVNPAGTVLFEKRYYEPSLSAGLTPFQLCKASGTDQGYLLYGGNCVSAQYIIKCDVNGNIVWVRDNYAPGVGFICSLMPDGNDYIGAFSYLNNSIISPGAIRMDASGNVLACRVFETTVSVQMNYSALTKLNNGNFVLMANPGNAFYGFFLYTLDATLQNVSCTKLSCTNQAYFTAIYAAQNSSDEVVAYGGYGSGSGCAVQVNPSTGVTSFAKYGNFITTGNSGGTRLSNGNYLFCGSSGYLGASFAVLDNTGAGFCSPQNITMTPQTNFPFTATNKTITNLQLPLLSSTYNFPFTPINLTASTMCGALSDAPEFIAGEDAIKMYPNPTHNLVTVTAEGFEIEAIRVLNIAGQEMQRISGQGQSSQTIELSSYESGVYFIEIVSGDQRIVRRIVRE